MTSLGSHLALGVSFVLPAAQRESIAASVLTGA
jgi:hypothetical protein